MNHDDSWYKVKKMLNLCLDLPKEQRLARLSQVCSDNLCRQRVSALLTTDEEKHEFLERPLIRILESGYSLNQYFEGDPHD